MNLRPYWQFYRSIFPFIAAFGFVVLVLFGVLWGYLLFCTLAFGMGLLGFQYFKKNEYYSYYNLGITKWQLAKSAFIINLLVGLPIFLVCLPLFLFIFGSTSIT
tara:strand:+ start:22423 stop:22734 length:312 start_codon:yes stop_codon:yes gene_type:complete